MGISPARGSGPGCQRAASGDDDRFGGGDILRLQGWLPSVPGIPGVPPRSKGRKRGLHLVRSSEAFRGRVQRPHGRVVPEGRRNEVARMVRPPPEGAKPSAAAGGRTLRGRVLGGDDAEGEPEDDRDPLPDDAALSLLLLPEPAQGAEVAPYSASVSAISLAEVRRRLSSSRIFLRIRIDLGVISTSSSSLMYSRASSREKIRGWASTSVQSALAARMFVSLRLRAMLTTRSV